MLFRIALFSLFFTGICQAQGLQRHPYGTWTSYLSHRVSRGAVVRGEEVFAITEGGLARYNAASESLNLWTVLDGLAGVSAEHMYLAHDLGLVFLGYNNGTIEYFQNPENRTVLIDIALTDNFIQKNVTDFAHRDSTLFVGTGFGVVVYDLTSQETRFTYAQIADQTEPFVNSLAVFNDSLFVALNAGLFATDLNLPIITDADWVRIAPSVFPGPVQTVRASTDELYALVNDSTLFYRADSGWVNVRTLGGNSCDTVPLFEVRDLNAHPGQVYANIGQDLYLLSAGCPVYRGFVGFADFIALGEDNAVAASNGDSRQRLRVLRTNGELAEPLDDLFPTTNRLFRASVQDNNLFLVEAAFSDGNEAPLFSTIGVLRQNFATGEWRTYGPGVNGLPGSAHSITSVTKVPGQEEFWFTAWDNGIFHVQNGQLVAQYTGDNSSLEPFVETPFFRVPDLTFGPDSTLWTCTNNASGNGIAFRSPEGAWGNVNLGGLFFRVALDNNNNPWFTQPETGIWVVDASGENSPRALRPAVGQGDLPNIVVNDLALDRDGTMWVATNDGVSAFFNTAGIFDFTQNTDAVCPIVGGRCLLEETRVTAIAVDGANRKYFGTDGGGVFFFNPQGNQELAHFTTENSPLISNRIFDLAIDPATGELFIVTDLGAISYQAIAVEGRESNENLVVYPNPYEGPCGELITLKTTTPDARALVTTTGGQLVRELTAQGGNVAWDGRDVQGNCVRSGVYVVAVSDANGEQTGTATVAIVRP